MQECPLLLSWTKTGEILRFCFYCIPREWQIRSVLAPGYILISEIFFHYLFICIFCSMLSWTFLIFFSTVLNFLSFLQSPLLTSTQPCILHSFVYRGLKTQTDLSPCNLRVSIGEFSRNFHIIILALQPPVCNQDIIAICHDAILMQSGNTS